MARAIEIASLGGSPVRDRLVERFHADHYPLYREIARRFRARSGVPASMHDDAVQVVAQRADQLLSSLSRSEATESFARILQRRAWSHLRDWSYSGERTGVAGGSGAARRSVHTTIRAWSGVVTAAWAGIAALLVVAAMGVVGCASDAREVSGATAPESAPFSEFPEATNPSTSELTTPRVAPGRLEWFGDSLTASSVAELRAAFASAFGRGWSLEVSSFGGTALCDWTAEIHEALRSRVKPALIVLAFYGNNFTPCMGAESPERPTIEQGSPGFYDRYRSAMEQVARWSDQTGVPVTWVQAPPRAPDVPGGPVDVRDGLDALAREQGWPVLEAGRALGDDNGGFAAWLPCDGLDGSACIDGQVKVRSDDLVHFEPAADLGEVSPGSRRWADEAFALIADTVGT